MEDRKARLAALAARAGRGGGGGGGGAASQGPTIDGDDAKPARDRPEDIVGGAPMKDGDGDSSEIQHRKPTDDTIEQDPAASSTKKELKFRNYSTTAATAVEPSRGAEGLMGDGSGSPAAKKVRRAAGGKDNKPSIGSSSTSSSNKPPKSALELALEKAAAASSSSTAVTGGTIADDDGDGGIGGGAAAALAPKKLNWDLKRDIQPKLDKLERRTQRAIVQLLQERLGRDAAASAGSANGSATGVEDLD